jgi:diguanylate cyclase (GGDEF)-like protein
VLRQVARVIAGQLRESDVAARWSDDAFLVVLSGTPLDNALLCAERVRKAVARLSNFMNEPVVVSGGVVQLIPGETLSEVVRRAESLVKAAKSGGGNRIR